MRSPSPRGPLFVVGVPRSGTTLVRALLNLHPKISLTLSESKIIPPYVLHYGDPPPFRTTAQLVDLYRDLARSRYGLRLARRGIHLDPETLARQGDPASWAGIFEPFLRRGGPRPDESDILWGDKSPGYLRFMPLLQSVFPGARFLHVIRDPRDNCLSVQRSFGRDPIRAGHRWRLWIEQADLVAGSLGDDYAEITYEELLAEPEACLRRLCEWLDLAYEPGMLLLDKSGEEFGSTRGLSGIVTANTDKWRTQLPKRVVARIEGIVGDVARRHGYEIGTPGEGAPLRRPELRLRRLLDLPRRLRHVVRQAGSLAGGLRLFAQDRRLRRWATRLRK